MELLDVLDEYGNNKGKTIERGQPLAEGEYILIIDVWIINNSGKLLISKRAPDVRPDPDKWQPTTGCVIASEDSITAALRETKEELGITLNPQKGKMLRRFISWPGAIIDVWLFYQEVKISAITLCPNEIVDVKWASKEVVKSLYKNNDFIRYGKLPYMEHIVDFFN